jgi:hypothetical protein
MNFTDVKLFEFVPDAGSFILLSTKVDLPIGDPRLADIAKRGRLAEITNGNSIGKTRIYGDPSQFRYDHIILEIRENIGSENQLDYTNVFVWLANEFPNHTASHIDKVIKDFEGGAYTKRTHTIILNEVDALKFRLMFSYSSA